MKKIIIVIGFLFPGTILFSQVKLPVPSASQTASQKMEFYLFMHFGPNTFTDKEWGHGDEPEDVFNPTQLDCRQWARVAKQAGAKGIIITAKHHDGFCLWPSKYSVHTVKQSKWKDGKGDVLKDLSKACKESGLKFGVYISPWDRNHPDYGTAKYNDVFVSMMKELFANYGPIWELWWDGANGEGPNGKKQQYDWDRFKKTVKSISPNTVVFSDIGPHIRWIGNEQGFAGTTNWNTLDTIGFRPGIGAPHVDTLNRGNVNGRFWIPGECDVSIRPGWFYHKEEDSKVKSPEELFELYLKSVGRGANLLLNVPPDRRGRITEYDSAALVGFRKLREENLSKNLSRGGKGYLVPHNGSRPAPALNDGNEKTLQNVSSFGFQSVGIEFPTPQEINCIVLKEDLSKGQHCAGVRLLLMDKEHRLLREIKATTIGHKRIITFPKTMVSLIVVEITNAKGNWVALSEIEAYLIDENLVEK